MSGIKSRMLGVIRGFSLVEILVVVTIMATLLVLGFINFRSFTRSVELSASTNEIISILHLAADRTMSSKGDTVYGVHFESDFYTLFIGGVYDSGDPLNEIFILPTTIEIYNIDLNGSGVDVVFDRVTGGTNNYGNVDLRIISDPSETKNIDIFSSGIAGYEGVTTLTDTRITDARHTHFDLGWSIQGANTLTLYFSDSPNPDVQEDIDMTNYFDPGETEFDWTGIVDVNGENQTLRAHTHLLDGFDTELCIHRDGRYNTKAVDVSIDGNDIASYTASGGVSVGAFGGTMEEL